MLGGFLVRWVHLLIALSLSFSALSIAVQPTAGASAHVSGPLVQWQTATIDFAGPTFNELDSNPNPFLDYRLQVTLRSPTGAVYSVPGFFDGDGNGGGSGNIWRVRFTPDAAGRWDYAASFRTGPGVAVDPTSDGGTPAGFDGASGAFGVVERDQNAPGFLKWGRLEYMGGHYLKFRDGPYWIKGGTNSPETFLGYGGFDDTLAGPLGHLTFENHVQDWGPGDPDWGAEQGRGIIGALNYFEQRHINSVYFLPMNIGGDGRNTWPYAGPINPAGGASNDNTHFDISKLTQWEQTFAHAQRSGVVLHVVLNEAERANKRELDEGTLGPERKLFYRELVARFAHHNALQWNISEEYDWELPLGPDTVKEFAGYLQDTDPYRHPITVHNNGNPDSAWAPFVGDSRFSVTSFQYPGSLPFPHSVLRYGDEVEEWRERTTASGRPIPIALDELRATTATNVEAQRKELIWPTYLSGGMMEHYIGGAELDKVLDDFRAYEALWDQSWYARKLLEQHLPFWEMEPHDSLLAGEATDFGGGQVFAKPGQVYAVYLPNASLSATLDLSRVSGTFNQRWYNPRTGAFEGFMTTVAAGAAVSLGLPPSAPTEDWALVIEKGTPTPTATAEPPTTEPDRQAVVGFTLIDAVTDQPLFALSDGATIDLAQLPVEALNVRADTSPSTVGSVRIGLNGHFRTENNRPYSLMGDQGGDYEPWTPRTGVYTISATPYTEKGAAGAAGVAHTITIRLVSSGGLGGAAPQERVMLPAAAHVLAQAPGQRFRVALPMLSAGASPQPADIFPYGVFDSHATLGASPERFAAMIADLQSRGLDSVLLTNSSPLQHGALLDVSDRMNFKVVMATHIELEQNWWPDSVPADKATAGRVIQPLVAAVSSHPSLIAYNIKDDASFELKRKIALAVEVFRELDPARPALAMLPSLPNALEVSGEVQTSPFLTFGYPFQVNDPPCKLNDPHVKSWVDGIREKIQYKDPAAPLWWVLQTHSTAEPGGGESTQLREPTVEEIRLQNWIILGEGARGIFWFIYSTVPSQPWVGLVDNEPLYAEVTNLARRVGPLRPTLLKLRKARDQFTAEAPQGTYISTLEHQLSRALYIVVANDSCADQEIVIRSAYFRGTLRNVESGELYSLGEAIPFRGGDGALLEVINATPITPTPAPPQRPNLVLNGSFEDKQAAELIGWHTNAFAAQDTTVAYSGDSSIKLSGDGTFRFISQSIALKPATKYTLMFWMKIQSSTGSGDRVGIRYVELPSSEKLADTWKNGDTGWVRRVVYFSTPEDYHQGRLDITWTLAPQAVVWVDEVAVYEGTGP
jgi:hypothetical protein